MCGWCRLIVVVVVVVVQSCCFGTFCAKLYCLFLFFPCSFVFLSAVYFLFLSAANDVESYFLAP